MILLDFFKFKNLLPSFSLKTQALFCVYLKAGVVLLGRGGEGEFECCVRLNYVEL